LAAREVLWVLGRRRDNVSGSVPQERHDGAPRGPVEHRRAAVKNSVNLGGHGSAVRVSYPPVAGGIVEQPAQDAVPGVLLVHGLERKVHQVHILAADALGLTVHHQPQQLRLEEL
jgi:hypothetical protein